MTREEQIKKAALEIGLTEFWGQKWFTAGAKWADANLNPEREAAIQKLVEAVKDILWINECRCDGAYTSRKMHGPNTLCGELDELIEAWNKCAAATEFSVGFKDPGDTTKLS